ncbi:MAG: N-acetyl-gamma-glutamyl-phosphate reductase [Planctomycetota bacterium]|jgi:N-acetyl-gamma-glutamyl-phosphate reductase
MSNERVTVAVVGASGYGGAETLRWLLRHPVFEPVAALGRRAAGKRVDEVHDFLVGATDLVITEEDAAEVAKRVDAMVFALPHGEAAVRMPAVLDANPELRVVDLSGDFRLADSAAWEEAYGMTHPAPDLCGSFVYGFPEAHRADIAATRLVANPGCFATGAAVALFPLAARGMLEGEAVVFGVTGSSGSGAEPKATTHHPERAHDFKAYRVLRHQHVPEIEQLLRESGAGDPRVSMVPHSAPMVRGIFTTATVETASNTDAAVLRGVVEEVYGGEPFIRLRDETPRVGVVAGTNFADLSIHAEGRRVMMLSAIDNLGKGMASQGVQNLNLMFGLPEVTGLVDFGGRP